MKMSTSSLGEGPISWGGKEVLTGERWVCISGLSRFRGLTYVFASRSRSPGFDSFAQVKPLDESGRLHTRLGS